MEQGRVRSGGAGRSGQVHLQCSRLLLLVLCFRVLRHVVDELVALAPALALLLVLLVAFLAVLIQCSVIEELPGGLAPLLLAGKLLGIPLGFAALLPTQLALALAGSGAAVLCILGIAAPCLRCSCIGLWPGSSLALLLLLVLISFVVIVPLLVPLLQADAVRRVETRAGPVHN